MDINKASSIFNYTAIAYRINWLKGIERAQICKTNHSYFINLKNNIFLT